MSKERRQKVFISRTSKGLSGIAEQVAAALREREIEPIIQTEFLPHWASVRQMLQGKLIDCDAAICLIGTAHGGEPDEPISDLRDERTEGRRFSFTQIEFLVARDLPRPVFTFLLSGPDLVEPYESESPDLAERQQGFIDEFAKDRRTVYYDYTDAALLLGHIAKMEIPRTVSAGKPTNLPYASLGTLFKGREKFLGEVGASLEAESTAIIRGRQAIHGMGGVGKTRAAVEFAWRNADRYNALLFVEADTPDDLRRNLAALCGLLVLNLPEQDVAEHELQTAAALRWLRDHPGWFLIIDNVDTDKSAEATEGLLADLGNGHIIVTSRIADWSGQVEPLDLDVLDEEPAAEFLLERTRDRRIPMESDADDSRTLAGMLDGLALALEQAAAYIREQRITIAAYIGRWHATPEDAVAWHDAVKMQYPRSLAITYETSVEQLSGGAGELFQRLAWLAPDPVPMTALESEDLELPGDARAFLLELDTLHLVRLSADGQGFAVHRLVQEISRQRQCGDVLRSPALPETLRWIDRLFIGDPGDVRSWPTLDPLAPHAQAVSSFADVNGFTDPTSRLMNQLALLFLTKAQHGAAEPLIRRSLEIYEKTFDSDHPDIASVLNNLVALFWATNRLAEAEPLMRRVVEIFVRFTLTTGHPHPHSQVAIENYSQLLDAMGKSKAQIAAQIREIAPEFLPPTEG